MSLLLLFTPSYFEGLHDSGPRIVDRYKRRHGRKVKPKTEKEDRKVEAISEEAQKKALETIKASEASKDRARYLNYLKGEIGVLSTRLKTVSELKDVLKYDKWQRKMHQVEVFRQALEAEYYKQLELQIEENFLMLAFFHFFDH